MSIGEKIKQRREELDMTQSELADRVGTSQPRVVDMEHDDVDPRISTLKRYAIALSIDPSVLISDNCGQLLS